MNRRRILLAMLAVVAGLANPLGAQDAVLGPPDVPYEPSTPEQALAMLRLAKVTSRDVVYDLGCGDGRIVIAAAKQFGARGVGIDIDPVRIRESVENARQAGVARMVRFRNEDLFQSDIHDATVVTLFLWPWVNLQLLPKLLHDLAPGTRVVSHYHDMGDWKPEKVVEVGGHKLYLWTIPAVAQVK